MKYEERSDYAVCENTVEPPSNVYCVCADCAPKPSPRYRRMKLRAFVGKLCKLAFPAESTLEHMWVHCTGPARNGGQELGGTLDSEPAITDGIRRGDWIEFTRSEIEDVFENEEAQNEQR